MQKKYKFLEFVTVIVIIIILAVVMVYTFCGLVKKAKESDASQQAAMIYEKLSEDTEYNLSEDDVDLYIVVDGYVYEVIDDEVFLAYTAECEDDIVTSAIGTEGAAYYTRHATYDNVYVYTGIQEQS